MFCQSFNHSVGRQIDQCLRLSTYTQEQARRPDVAVGAVAFDSRREQIGTVSHRRSTTNGHTGPPLVAHACRRPFFPWPCPAPASPTRCGYGWMPWGRIVWGGSAGAGFGRVREATGSGTPAPTHRPLAVRAFFSADAAGRPPNLFLTHHPNRQTNPLRNHAKRGWAERRPLHPAQVVSAADRWLAERRCRWRWMTGACMDDAVGAGAGWGRLAACAPAPATQTCCKWIPGTERCG